VRLEGQLPLEELDLDNRDEMVKPTGQLRYDLDLQKVEDGLLVHGRLALALACECVRCLKPFTHKLKLEPWTRLLPLTGEEATPVVNDCVDLTPYLREDILLEFPQHPLCDQDCRGLPKTDLGESQSSSSTGPSPDGSSAWDELNKLKF
ncbi:MAG TPA: YceD family protein, partial [Verrucomicrobiae bacterium]|nr:YceD family protein [Verrucomicrobiae bacterium]